jgi:hypothetical protein
MEAVEKSRATVAMAVALGLLAYAISDTAHEVLGHLSAAWLLGFKPYYLSSVGLQTGPAMIVARNDLNGLEAHVLTSTSDRLLAASGSAANVLLGLALIVAFLRRARLDASGYLLWLTSAVSLMNGIGYLVASAIIGSGDWALVISGLSPAWLWRALLGATGAALYVAVVHYYGRALRLVAGAHQISFRELRRAVLAAYVAGGVLLTAAAALNPYGWQLIFISGMGASFALTAGLLRIASDLVPAAASENLPLFPRAEFAWLFTSTAVALVFVFVFGRGFAL